MAVRAYSLEERRVSNVKGKLGKQQLPPKRMEKVRKAVVEQYPVEGFENEKDTWADCVRAIDESGRKQ